MTANHPDALIIFAKWPEPGKVKTRLSPPLTPDESAELYRCMLLDTLDATSGIVGIKRLIFFGGPAQRAADFRMMAPDADVYRQRGKDLGERLAAAFETTFANGFRRVAVIGTDSPHMPPERIPEAFSLLNGGSADVVIGPTEDGGYYLLALNKPHLGIFHDMPWSSSKLLHETIWHAEKIGLRPSQLLPCFDLDRVEDLCRLMSEQQPSTARHTREMLRSSSLVRQ